ncbi:MAG: UvrD-helicase domain-containing protein [Thermoguttaceae bacterium]
MNHLLEGLTPQQREAVMHLEGPLLILAGAGSGKTRVVTHRVAWLLANGIQSWHILALTFTNKAAEEMQQRIERLVGDNSVWVGTFHRFCARLLRKYASFVGLQENFSIYDTDDSIQALRKAIRQAGTDVSHLTPDAIARAISWAKNNLISPSQYQASSSHLIGILVQKIYPYYQSSLLSSNAADFDDLLLHVATLLRENPEVRQSLDERYRFILVDEYQDTNLAQYAIARALSIDHPNLAVTGDPDQSIYGWRGANLNNILEFERDYPNVRVVRLERNYRSTKRILRVAADLIAHNVRRKEKSLYTENGPGVPVRLVRYETHKDEAEEIAARIGDEIRTGRRRPRDFAVFYRVNALSLAFELAMRAQGIAFQMVNSLEFFQRREIKDLLAYLQMLNNPMDEVAFMRVINTPARGIGKKTVEKLSDFALNTGIGMIDAARRVRQINSISSNTAGKICKFVDIFDRLSQLIDRPLEELLGHLLNETGYREQYASGDEEDQERLANIEQLLTVARDFDERHGGGSHQLEAFLEETCLVNDTDDWQTQGDRVTLMTLHSSKGLEFPMVFIVAAEEGLLPHERSREQPDKLEEERRLMFVGITRAQQEVQISLARYRDFRGRRMMTIPSCFLMELPREEMELVNFGPSESLVASSLDAEPYTEEELSALDQSQGEYEEPVARRIEPAGTVKSPPFLQMTTAAELANGGAPLAPVSPEDFIQGGLVRHPQYGLGRTVALSGSGLERQATVEFPPPAGQMKLLLANSQLRPVTQVIGGKE